MSTNLPSNFQEYQVILHKKEDKHEEIGANNAFNGRFEDVREIQQDGYTISVMKTQSIFKQENEKKGRFKEYSLLLRRTYEARGNKKERLQLEIQSDCLRESFSQFAKDMTTIRLNHDPIVIPEPFMEIFYCRVKIQEAFLSDNSDARLKRELQLLIDFQDQYMTDTISTVHQFISSEYIEYAWLWAIFLPGELVVIMNLSASDVPI
ncbi:hypothetical protein J3F84DRAFT_198459 [Trichoderma pleuroticola]